MINVAAVCLVDRVTNWIWLHRQESCPNNSKLAPHAQHVKHMPARIPLPARHAFHAFSIHTRVEEIVFLHHPCTWWKDIVFLVWNLNSSINHVGLTGRCLMWLRALELGDDASLTCTRSRPSNPELANRTVGIGRTRVARSRGQTPSRRPPETGTSPLARSDSIGPPRRHVMIKLIERRNVERISLYITATSRHRSVRQPFSSRTESKPSNGDLRRCPPAKPGRLRRSGPSRFRQHAPLRPIGGGIWEKGESFSSNCRGRQRRRERSVLRRGTPQVLRVSGEVWWGEEREGGEEKGEVGEGAVEGSGRSVHGGNRRRRRRRRRDRRRCQGEDDRGECYLSLSLAFLSRGIKIRIVLIFLIWPNLVRLH